MANLHDLIDAGRLVARTSELVQIPSVNPFDDPMTDDTGEQLAGEWLAEHLDRLGWSPTFDVVDEGRPNVLATGPGGDGDVLCLSGHLDTVGVTGYDDPFSGAVANGRIHGRGTCDMKGALVAFLEVAEVLAESNTELAGRVMIAAIADEEHAMHGSAHAGAAGPIADHLIVGEPTSLAICPAHKGQYAFPIRTEGRAVHSSIKHEGVNAIEHMMQIMRMLGEYEAEIRANEPHDLLGLARSGRSLKSASGNWPQGGTATAGASVSRSSTPGRWTLHAMRRWCSQRSGRCRPEPCRTCSRRAPVQPMHRTWVAQRSSGVPAA
jgi:acetylornithine deacetylase